MRSVAAQSPAKSDSGAAWLYGVSRILVPPFRLLWRMRTFGASHVPARGPLILAANHTSFLDPWFIGATFPRSPIRFLINEPWYSRWRLGRILFRQLAVVPVKDGDPDSTIARVVEALHRGDVVGIFPEGGISHDGRPRRPRSGIAYIAARSGAPVIPCGLRGAFEALPRDRRIPRRHDVHLHIGPAIRFAPTDRRDLDARDAREFARRVMREVNRLAGHSASD